MLFIGEVRHYPQEGYKSSRVVDKVWRYNLLSAGIGMQSNQIEIYTKIGHQNTGEGNNTR